MGAVRTGVAGRAALALLAACGLVAVGCSERSRVDPEASVTVSGTVRAPDGTPLAGRPVRLGGGVGVDEGALAVLTLGLACTTGVCSGNVVDATTAADGTYRFELRGRDTQSTFGEALTQLVSVSAPPGDGQVSGAAASARFLVQVEDVRLPMLDLVDPGLVVGGGTDVTARWSTPRPGPYELTFEAADTVPLWRATTAQGSATVDPRVLEDTAGRVVVSGASTDAVEGSDVTLHWRSPGIPYVAGAGAPPSRGRPCRFVDAAGATGPPQTACGLTDGDLTVAEPLPSCPAAPPPAPASTVAACPPTVAAVVDLGEPVPVGLVVVRGCEGGCAVEVSADGVAFRRAGAVGEGFGTVALGGQPVTAVRVGTGSGSGLREVSVWGPRPATASLRSTQEESRRLRDQFGSATGDADDDGVPVWLGALAAALIGAALAGVGFVAGRRPAARNSGG